MISYLLPVEFAAGKVRAFGFSKSQNAAAQQQCVRQIIEAICYVGWNPNDDRKIDG